MSRATGRAIVKETDVPNVTASEQIAVGPRVARAVRSRRGRGEGSIFLRNDGRWSGVVDLGWVDGRRERKTVYGKTRKEAHQRLMAVQLALGSGLRPAPDRLTIETYLADWLAATQPTIRPSTFRSYELFVRIHLNPAIGRIPLVRLSVADVEKLLRAKLATGLSPRTVAMIRGTLRRALGRAVRARLVAANVASLADPPRQERHEVHPLTPDQARQFLDAISGHRLEGLFVVALTTGLRSGEIRALRWQDIDLEERHVTVDAGLARIDGAWHRVPPKSNAGRRNVPLIDRAVIALREHRTRQLTQRLAAGSGWVGNPFDLVFTSEIGTPLDSSNVVHAYQRELLRAGLPRQRFHDTRHAVATFWVASGVPIKVVSEMLGHSQISLTLNTYSHVHEYQRADARERLGSLLGG
jgi:integrase